jgi:putative hydrolase of the HAD superfamily
MKRSERQAIETVFLDAGGVLVHPNYSRVSEALQRHGVMVAAAGLGRADLLAKRELDAPQMMRDTAEARRGWHYFNLVLKHARIPLTEATDAALAELKTYHQSHNLWESVADDVAPTLARLRARGLRLVVVSNANGMLAFLMERLGLAPSFDVILDSHVEGVEKPDPRLFRIALERSGGDPRSTIHVGDLYHVDVLGARAAGLRAVLFDAGGLYPEVDCPRVASLRELEGGIGAGPLV